jgi:hypothetical protein
MSELSPTTRALLRAAREDGPSAAGRAKIWTGVASGGLAGGTAVGAAGGKAAAGAATAKLFVMGALLGSAVTVGVAAMMLGVGAPHARPDAAAGVRGDTATEVRSAAGAVAPSIAATPAPGEDVAPLPLNAPHAEHGRHAGHARSLDDSLNREAQLVAEARGAVVRGQPAAALSAIRAAQALPAHAMEPEELSLEVRALRELGRLDEANAVDARLRARFPDHALAR